MVRVRLTWLTNMALSIACSSIKDVKLLFVPNKKCSLIVTVAKYIMCILTTLLNPLNHHLRSSITYGNKFASGSYSPSVTFPHPLLDPPPLGPPLALTRAHCSLRCPADVWLEVETEKEALGVFIEPRSFTRTITTLPHMEKQIQETAFWFHISMEGSYQPSTHLCINMKIERSKDEHSSS